MTWPEGSTVTQSYYEDYEYGRKITVSHKHDNITFYAWNGDNKANTLPSAEGSYYLTEDVSLWGSWTVPTGTTYLCLNGHTISKDLGSVIIVNSGSTLYLYDEDNTGKITGASTSGIVVNGGTLVLNGGAITGNTSSYGAGVWLNAGSFTMNGGIITQNTATDCGGGVYVYSDTFTMNGGSITQNSNSNPSRPITGGVHICQNGTFNMNGGTISGNNSEDDSYYAVNYYGAGVTIDGGTFNLGGGVISDDIALLGTLIHVQNDLGSNQYAVMLYDGTTPTIGVITSGFSGKGDAQTFSRANLVDNDSFVALNSEGEAILDRDRVATFTSTEGTGDAPDPITAESGAEITLPYNTYTASEMLFIGWSDGTDTYSEGATYTLNEDTAFTAVWAQCYYVPTSGTTSIDLRELSFGHTIMIYDVGGPTDDYEANADGSLRIQLSEGHALKITGTGYTEPSNDVLYISNLKTSLELSGPLNLNVSVAGVQVTIRLKTNADDNYEGFALRAELIDGIYYTASFTTDEGTGTDPRITELAGNTITLPANPYRVNYKFFAGWSDGEQTYSEGASYILNGDVTFTAVWDAGKVASFTTEEGTGSAPADILKPTGAEITLPENPYTPAEGRYFIGWSDGAQTYAPGDPYTLSEDTVFTAQWVDSVVVSFNSNGGSDVAAQTIPEGGTATEPTAPTRNGYIFNKWLLNSEAFDFSTPIAEDITLTALWNVGTDLVESFEDGFPPTDWQQEGNKFWAKVGLLLVDPEPAITPYSGLYCVKYPYNSGATGYLIMPKQNFSGASSAKLSFYYVNCADGNNFDQLAVSYRIDGGAWNDTGFLTTQAHTEWTLGEIELPADALTENVEIAFVGMGKGGLNLGLDDVLLKAAVPHTHSFSYTADGTTITRTCAGMADNTCPLAPATLTLILDNDGMPTVTTTDATAFPNVQIVYKRDETVLDAQPTTGGRYTASVTFDEATATLEYIIDPIVTYDCNDGSTTPFSDETVPYNTAVTEPPEPDRIGYMFTGWTLNGRPYNFGTPVTEDITLVAQWQELAPVTYLSRAWDAQSGKVVTTEVTLTHYNVVTTKTTDMMNGNYVVNADTTISNRITVIGNVNLILCDGVKLTANKGISVSTGNPGNTLNIYGQTNDTGELEATGSVNAAAIGGNYGDSGTINISGGTVKAYGGGNGAGIGGGDDGVGGTITFNGGAVTANGGGNGAGIGGGSAGAGGTISIIGGQVTANGDNHGAGIGPGYAPSDPGALTVSLSSADDFIQASGYTDSEDAYIAFTVEAGFTLTDGQNIYSGTLTPDQLESIAGMKLTKAVLYNVTVTDSANGTVDASSTSAMADTEITLTIEPANGYVLSSLSVGSDDVTDEVSGGTYTFTMPPSDVTVSATFAQAFTVTFDPANGEATFEQTVVSGGTATEPDAPTKPGFRFEGWTLEGEAYNFATAVNSNITLVASWTDVSDNAMLASAQLVFEGIIQVKLNYILPDALKTGNNFVVFEGIGDDVRFALNAGKANGNYTSFFYEVPIPNYSDSVTVRLVDANNDPITTVTYGSGKDITAGFTFSVKDFAEKQAADEDASQSMKELAQALADYGNAAQRYFRSDTAGSLPAIPDDVINVQASDMDAYNISATGDKPSGIKSVSLTTSFNSDNRLTVYFTFKADADPDAYTFKIRKHGEENAVEQDLLTNGSKYYLKVDNIPAAKLGDAYDFIVVDGNAEYIVTCSALTYAKSVIQKSGDSGMVTLAKALYLYRNAAKAYFDKSQP